MRQFQFEYQTRAQFMRNLAIIKRFCMKNKPSCVLIQGFANDVNLETIEYDCKKISEELPNAQFYGCSVFGSIHEGKISVSKATITCTIMEDSDSWVEIKSIEPNNPKADFNNMHQLWGYCNRHLDTVAVEILATRDAAKMLNIGNEKIDLRKNIAVFGGITANPKHLVGETVIFSSKPGLFHEHGIAVIYHGKELHVNASFILGWKPLGKNMKATSCEGNVLKELDGMPAFDIYKKYLGIDNDALIIYNAVQFPLLVEKAGISCTRNVVSIDDNGEIEITVNIDHGTKVSLAYADKNTILWDVKLKYDELAEYTPDAIKIYSCGGRRLYWGDEEVSRESEPMETLAATSGFYTAGEILRIGDFLHYLNTTMVVAAFREGETLEYGYDIRDDFQVMQDETGVVAKLVHYVGQMESEMQGQYTTSLRTIASIYNTMYAINLKEKNITPIKGHKKIAINEVSSCHNLNEYITKGFVSILKPKYVEEAKYFFDISTVDGRMKDLDIIDAEFESNDLGWLRIQLIVISRDYEGKIEDLVLTTQRIDDIIQQKRMLEKAKKENDAKSAFLANMSHEIRTPINSILGFDTMILRESKDKAVREYASKIKDSGDILLEIVNSILDISKIASGRMELVEQPYDFKELINSVINMIYYRARKKDLELQININSKLPRAFKGDETKLKQVLLNLLTNAVKYTNEGHIALEVTGYANVNDNSKYNLTFSVKDTGIGIKDADKNNLFSRFTRFDPEKNRYTEGTGLGLSLVYSFLKLMHSEPKLESVYGKGSNFYFQLEQEVEDSEAVGKIVVQPETIVSENHYEAGFAAPEAKILVTDDTPTNLDVFCSLLKETEVQITKATSGMETLELTAANKYDIIFLDHMMPKMDGIETLHKIRADKDNKNFDTPIYVLTANAIQGMQKMYENEGFDGYLSKPVNPDLLEKTIWELLPKELIVSVDKQTVQEDKTEQVENIEDLPMINGINWNYSQLHLGKTELITSTVESFCFNADKEAARLEELWQQCDTDEGLKDYRVQIHAMKNAGMLLGIFPISGMALTLEMAADAENRSVIMDMTAHFLDIWHDYAGKLKEAFNIKSLSEQDLPICEKSVLINFMEDMQEALDDFDISAADKICAELKKYSYPKGVGEKIEGLLMSINEMDSDTAEAIVEEIMQEVEH